jgi:UDP-N-acetylmuramyl tripeptide synthase
VALPFDDSRRLTGGNLFFAGPGAVLEAAGLDLDDAVLAAWRACVERARTHLGWPHGAVVARRHAGGASLAIAAPPDQLFTATELNEWALCAAAYERDPARWARVESALVATALAQADDPATVDPPVIDEAAAFARFERLAAAEQRPDVLALMHAAATHGLATVGDERALTLGTGAGGRSWGLDELPRPAEVAWPHLRNVPVAAVTGSNGKTTTVRLIAACARAHGWRDGYCCTDGVFVGGQLVEAGDYSGPAGTRHVLRDAQVDAAVLEMARGGLLRRGLAIDLADAAIVTNVSRDHFGEYGIFDLEGLADTKLTVAQLVARGGLLVLNADDALLRAKAATRPGRLGATPTLGWFALDYDRDELRRDRAAAGATAGVRDGRLWLSWRGAEHDLGEVAGMPLSVQGAASYNVANLAGAALVATALGIGPATLRSVFAQFAGDPADNAGRLMRFEVGGVRFLVDYAHNPDGLRGVLEVARRLKGRNGRLITLLGHAGNRRDEDIVELAQVAAKCTPDVVVVKEDEGHLRGRPPGEVPAILQRALLASGLPENAVEVRMSELEAARRAIELARPGDAVALLVHATAARAAVVELLQSRLATADAVGDRS